LDRGARANTSNLAAAGPPEGGCEERQGVQARARRPWPRLRCWARRTPYPAASDGRSTLGRPGHHAVRGIGDWLRRNPHPLVLERASRESAGPSPPSPRSELRGTGARKVCPPCRARCRTRPSAPVREAVPGHRRSHLRGARM